MKQELLSSLEDILNSSTSIKLHVDRVQELREKMDSYFSDEEKDSITGRIKSKVQQEARRAFYDNGYWGAIYMGTGSGKSRVAIDIASDVDTVLQSPKILIVVPTEKLRDTNWPDEFRKWGKVTLLSKVRIECYASIDNIEGEEFDLVVLDEGHNITENNSVFFGNNKVKQCLLLTATKPKNFIKLDILKELSINTIYTLSLDESVKLGVVAPYEITVVTTFLDTTEKYLKAGSQKKGYFFNTEKAHYGYLSARLAAMPNRMGFIDRMRFIYDLKSKTEAARWIIDNIIPYDLRTIIFCGSKDQANQLCDHRYYSKPQPPKKLPEKTTEAKKTKYESDLLKYNNAIRHWQGDTSLQYFVSGQINQLSCVEALNEGINIPELDVGFVVQLNSSDLDFIQRMGRILRFRPGHVGKIIVLCVYDTVDKNWVDKALAGLTGKITFVELSRLKMGIETISFD